MVAAPLLALLIAAAVPLASPTQEPVTVPVAAGVISGTLMIPSAPTAPMPVVLIIPGSGPVDRNGNAGPMRSDMYEKLARGLASAGIASLRYDKRGIGASAVSQTESQLRFNDYVDDAQALAHTLEADKRFSRVVVIGHSEGSLIGTMLVQRDPKIARFISLEGPGRNFAALINVQVNENPANGPYVKEIEDINASLLAGKTVANVDPVLMGLFHPSVQPFLISEYRIEPQRELAKVRIPVMIVHGTHDVQVFAQDEKNLLAADPKARDVEIDGMNHMLVDAPAQYIANVQTYGDPELPLDPKLIPALAPFIAQPAA